MRPKIYQDSTSDWQRWLDIPYLFTIYQGTIFSCRKNSGKDFGKMFSRKS